MEVSNDGHMANSQPPLQGLQPRMPVVSREGARPTTPDSSVRVDVPFIHYKQTARVQEVELPVDVTHVHVEKVEVQAPHEIPIIQPRELGVHQQTKRNNPSPIDVFTVQSGSSAWCSVKILMTSIVVPTTGNNEGVVLQVFAASSKKYQLPRLQPKYYDVEVPIYVPRYVEVPVPSHFVALNQEPLPDTLQLGPYIKSAVATAPVPVDNQVYSLAQAPVIAAPHAPQRRSHGENVPALRPSYLVRGPEKASESSSELMYFFPSVTEGPSASSNCRCDMRPAYYLTPAYDQTGTAPSNTIAALLRQNATAASGVLRPYSHVVEIRDVAGMQGVATVGQAASSRSVSGSSMDHAAASICSPSLVPAARCESAAAVQPLPQEGEELPEAGNRRETCQPPVVEIAA